MTSENQAPEIIELTTDILSAYVSNNAVAASELPNLIEQTCDALRVVSAREGVPIPDQQDPSVPIKKSVSPDALTCLECGKRFKSLKRHIRTDHDLMPEDYRDKWNLKFDYPMVAPNYAAARSALAKKMRFGRKR